jgi:DNA polymerase IIIc chi subunit
MTCRTQEAETRKVAAAAAVSAAVGRDAAVVVETRSEEEKARLEQAIWLDTAF